MPSSVMAGLAGVHCSGIIGELWSGTLVYFRRNIYYQRFEKIPNTGHIKIWLQRLTIKLDRQRQYSEKLCEKVNNPTLQIWNSDWIENNLKTIIETTPIIDEAVIVDIDVVIASEEIELFKSEYNYAEQTAE